MWADAIEQRPISTLTAYARNARTHSEAQIAQLQDSMREWGFTVPVHHFDMYMIIANTKTTTMTAAHTICSPSLRVLICAARWLFLR
ncbi:ParB N-terminal domain-containing protein [Paraburkholderia tropica]|uniref:Uncharacterized protein n=1 Tax=Paraburkholderia tropica TaxID=92647 RepID=A0AAQ1GMD8_9BURK|nr:hypothetical protein SAMN05216550_1232 [Paraburkholderia tropica]